MPNPVVISNDRACGCSCTFEQLGTCELTFTYTNTNQIQDDSFDIILIKGDGTEVVAGHISGLCNHTLFPGYCARVDTETFTFIIDTSYFSTACGQPCVLQFRCDRTADNGWGTGALFTIKGPYGVGYSGGFGSSGFVDISCCFPTI